MSTGMREILFNTQERAISSDLNRLQRFKGQDIGELFRYMLDAYANDDVEAGAIATVPGPGEAPGRAEIINGLLFRPQIGTQFGTVDAGVVYALANDGDGDASAYKFIRYDGDAGVLNIAAGGGGATRIDVIEFSVATSQRTVTESRDVFNPSTGLFTATSLVKEQRGWIQFRVRQGTAGAGFPGLEAGWTPIAIASVPSSSLNNDAVTFWDVRPMISDREFQPFALSSTIPRGPYVNGRIKPIPTGVNGGGTMNGHAQAVLNGRRVGGRIRRTSPGVDDAFVNFNDAANIEPGITFNAAFLCYVYIVTPFGLPRWARYTDATSGTRVPRSPRGLVMLSKTAPGNFAGAPASGLVLPSAYGLGSTPQTNAVCIAATKVDDPGSGYTTILTTLNGFRQTIGEFVAINVPAVSVSGSNARFQLIPGTHYPRNARALRVEFVWNTSITANNNANSAATLFVYDGLQAAALHQEFDSYPIGTNLANALGITNIRENRHMIDIGIPNPLPDAAQTFEVQLSSGTTINGTPQMFVVGWDFGP